MLTLNYRSDHGPRYPIEIISWRVEGSFLCYQLSNKLNEGTPADRLYWFRVETVDDDA